MKITTKNTNIDLTRLTLDWFECKISTEEYRKIVKKLNTIQTKYD